MKPPTIGFIGQGWIGRHYANDFERRGYEVIRYAKEPAYEHNREAIAQCDIVFIAVPTPTTIAGFDFSIVREVLELVGKGNTAVIKSTLLPGTTELLQSEFPWLYVFHSPEFLTEANAAWDAANPQRNIVGTPALSLEYIARARMIHGVLPTAPYSAIMPSAAAELVKYAGNCLLYTKVVFINLLYNVARELGICWPEVAEALAADRRLGSTHLDPVHDDGRGAGGDCFIKDFAALRAFYGDWCDDKRGLEMLTAIEQKNVELLMSTEKSLKILQATYAEGAD